MKEGPPHSTMHLKPNGLAINCENLAKIYANQTKGVSRLTGVGGLEKKGVRNGLEVP